MASSTAVLDKAFNLIMSRMVQTEHSPHYSELARDLGVSHEESRAVLCDLMATGYPGWLDTNTNYG